MNLRLSLALALLTAGCLAAAAPAETPPEAPRTLAGYLERATAANPGLAAYSLRYDAARERIPQLAALPDPMLQVSHFVESIETRTGPQRNAIMLSQRLPWFGRLSGRETMAGAEAEALWFAWQNRQLQLSREVALGYYDFAMNTKAIGLTAANLDLLQQLDPIVEERIRTGGQLNALLRLRVETGRLADQLATLRQRQPQLAARLAAQLALDPAADLPPPDWDPLAAPAAAEPPDPAGLLEAIDTHNPELQMLQRRLDSAAARRELARLESRPDFTVGINYIDTAPARLTPVPADSGRDPWSVFVAVNLPVWRERTHAARREARALEEAADADLADRRRSLHADARAAAAALADARRRIALYRDDLLPLARQAEENTRTAYESGSATLLDLIDAERSLLDLELALARAATDAAQRRVTLLALANQPL